MVTYGIGCFISLKELVRFEKTQPSSARKRLKFNPEDQNNLPCSQCINRGSQIINREKALHKQRLYYIYTSSGHTQKLQKLLFDRLIYRTYLKFFSISYRSTTIVDRCIFYFMLAFAGDNIFDWLTSNELICLRNKALSFVLSSSFLLECTVNFLCVIDNAICRW